MRGKMRKRTYDVSQMFTVVSNLLNVNLERVLDKMGLPAHPPQMPQLNLTTTQISLLFEHLVAEYGHDDFHIKLADGFTKGSFTEAFLALQCSETLREGIHRIAPLAQLNYPLIWMISETDASFSIRLSSPSQGFPNNGIGQIMTFLWLVKTCRNMTATHIVPSCVFITDEVPYQEDIGRDLGCPVRLADEALLEFPRKVMDTRNMTFNRQVVTTLDAVVSRSPREDLTTDGDSFIASVRAHILDLLPSGGATSERVAERLGLSKRSLERRLADHGESFSRLVSDCRFRQAQHYLRDTQLPIYEIGRLLGYREASSFFRAFKSWCGLTPQEVRN